MAKLVTVHHPEQTQQQAHEYIKAHILMPSGFLGLLCLIGGVVGLAYQMLATDRYTWNTFYQSSGLFILGVVFGVALTLYQRYLLREFPEVLAARMRQGLNRQKGKIQQKSEPPTISHSGRQFLPVGYLLGLSALLGSAIAAVSYGQVDLVPAFLMPWAGFYWARLFWWRRIIKVEK